MSEELKNNEAVVENDKDYEDILEKFENPKESSAPKKKKNSHIKTLVAVVAAAVVLAGVGAALLFAPNQTDSGKTKGPATVKQNVKNNVHEVQVKTDNNGKIKENGSGSFLKKVPSDIKEINVKNKKSEYTITSYTPKIKTKETDPETGKTKYKTDATVYKLLGYEGFKLQDGAPDEVASSCTTLKFNSVSSENAENNLKDFGLDKPRATVTVTYTDNTKAKFTVGNDAAQNLGTYVMFGSSKTVYLCDKDSAAKFLYGVTDFINKNINETPSDTSNGDPKSVTLSGTKLNKSITIAPNSDKKHVAANYLITSPYKSYADDSETSTVTGAIRGLLADSVEAVNPSASKISGCGLKSPYVKISAKFPDTDVNLIASKPDSKGKCYIMELGGKIIYKIASASIPWVDTSEEKLVSSYVFKPELSGLKKMSVNISGKTYDFDIKTTETKNTDDKGEETTSTETVTSYKNNTLNEGNFETYFNNINLLKKADKKTYSASGKPALTITYTYSGSKASETLSFYKSGSKYISSLSPSNMKAMGTVYSSYIDKLISQTPKVAKDEEVKTFW